MSKGLEALKQYRGQQVSVNVYADELLDIVEQELKALDIFRCIDKESFEEVPESHGTYVRLKTNIYIPKEKYKLLKEVLYRE